MKKKIEIALPDINQTPNATSVLVELYIPVRESNYRGPIAAVCIGRSRVGRLQTEIESSHQCLIAGWKIAARNPQSSHHLLCWDWEMEPEILKVPTTFCAGGLCVGRSRVGRSQVGRSQTEILKVPAIFCVGRSHIGKSRVGRSHVGRSQTEILKVPTLLCVGRSHVGRLGVGRQQTEILKSSHPSLLTGRSHAETGCSHYLLRWEIARWEMRSPLLQIPKKPEFFHG